MGGERGGRKSIGRLLRASVKDLMGAWMRTGETDMEGID